jgi:hypothetical protein
VGCAHGLGKLVFETIYEGPADEGGRADHLGDGRVDF